MKTPARLPDVIRRLRAEARWLLAVAYWLVESGGYWIRPYDMLADRRRWRWQPRQRCGFQIQCYHRYPCPQPTNTRDTPA